MARFECLRITLLKISIEVPDLDVYATACLPRSWGLRFIPTRFLAFFTIALAAS